MGAPVLVARVNNSGSVSNASLKALHAVLLRVLPVPAVREFWRPLVPELSGGDEAAAFRQLWDERARSPAASFSRAQARLERFLVENDVAVSPAIDALVSYFNRGTWMQAGLFLERIHRVLPKLFSASDPHRVVLQVIAANAKVEFGGARTHFGRARTHAGLSTAYGSLGPDPYSNEPVLYDANLIASRVLQPMPLALGLPAFEEPVFHVAECRTPAQVLWNESTSVRDGAFYVGRARHGSMLRFSTFLRRLGVTPPRWPLPNPVVTVIDRSYHCPRRERVVLHEGCAYGAPYYVARFRWRRVRPNRDGYLAPLALEPTPLELEKLQAVEALQRRLLADVERRTIVEYHAARDAISSNGVTLFSGAPARILRHVLRRYTQQGKELFELRDFKYDAEITRDPKRSGVEMRLSRIQQKLNGHSGLALARAGRGRVRFSTAFPITFCELP